MDRKIIVGLFIKTLEKNIASSASSIDMQKDYLADQPGPMQSRYDSGLVEGQWQMSAMKKNHDDMLRALAFMKKVEEFSSEVITNGSIVIINQNGAHNGYFLIDAKGAAGVTVLHDGRKYTAITPQSPLGKVLAGRKAGDIVEFKAVKLMRCLIEEVY